MTPRLYSDVIKLMTGDGPMNRACHPGIDLGSFSVLNEGRPRPDGVQNLRGHDIDRVAPSPAVLMSPHPPGIIAPHEARLDQIRHGPADIGLACSQRFFLHRSSHQGLVCGTGTEALLDFPPQGCTPSVVRGKRDELSRNPFA